MLGGGGEGLHRGRTKGLHRGHPRALCRGRGLPVKVLHEPHVCGDSWGRVLHALLLRGVASYLMSSLVRALALERVHMDLLGLN